MIRLTMILDGDDSEQLVGLISKALSRSELGILDVRIEAYEPPMIGRLHAAMTHHAASPPVNSAPPDEGLQALIKRLPRAKARQKTTKGRFTGTPLADIIYAFLKRSGPVHRAAIMAEIGRHGASPSSIGTAMNRALEKHPDIHQLQDRRWTARAAT